MQPYRRDGDAMADHSEDFGDGFPVNWANNDPSRDLSDGFYARLDPSKRPKWRPDPDDVDPFDRAMRPSGIGQWPTRVNSPVTSKSSLFQIIRHLTPWVLFFLIIGQLIFLIWIRFRPEQGSPPTAWAYD